MYVRHVKRKCNVRGCRCTDSYAISLSREVGNTVIICKSCLGKALGAIDDAAAHTEPKLRITSEEAPALFFNAAAKVAPVPEEPKADEVIPPAEDNTEDDTATPPADASEFVCPHCGQICKSELGLQKHILAKHKELA